MAGRKGSAQPAVGVVLVVVGIGLGLWGYQESRSLGNEMASALGGGATDEMMTLYIAGAASLAAGVFLLFRR